MHDDDPLAPARGIMIGFALSVTLFCVPLAYVLWRAF